MSRLAQVLGGQMLSISWRSSRRQLLAWTGGMVALFAATAASVNNLYGGSAAQLRTYAQATTADSAMYAINGRPFGLDNIGGPIVYEFGFIAVIGIPLMAIVLISRMTRLEEQSGRTELLRAGIVGRTAALRAAAVLTVAAFLVIAAGMVAVLSALGLRWPGVLLYPLALAALGVLFAAVGGLFAQLVARARAVTALGLGLLVLAFAVRGVGDVHGSFVVWLSPLGWTEQTRPFGDARWWALLPSLGVAVLAFLAAVAVAQRRDLGEGLFAQRRGRPVAGRMLLDPFGFAVRRHRNAVVGWSAVAVLVGAGFGPLGNGIDTLTEKNVTLRNMVNGGSDVTNAFVSFVTILIALVCVGFVISGVGRVAEEEAGGRLEPVLAGALSRGRWLAGHGLALAGGAIMVALAGGLGLGVSNAVSVADASQVTRLLGATLAYLPAVLLLLGLSLTLYGLRPAAMWIGWLALVFVAVVAVLGDTLRLADWVKDLSPLTWVDRVPLQTASTAGLVGAMLGALFLGAAALTAFRVRDVPAR